MNSTYKQALASDSKSFKKLNPQLFGGTAVASVRWGTSATLGEATIVGIAPKKRIRQDEKPLLNKLESEWLQVLKMRHPTVTIHSQEWRVKIANGAWFKVDHCALLAGGWTAWECKGPSQGKNVARGLLALKCAASSFPEVRWVLVWKDQGKWCEQEVMP